MQFILAELELAITFCRIVRSRPSPHTARMLRNARNALFHAMDYVFHSELTSCDIEIITAGCERLQSAMQEYLPQHENLIVAANDLG